MRNKKIDFLNEIVKLSLSSANASRSPKRNKKLSEKFVNEFLATPLRRYHTVNYDEVLISDHGMPIKCDVVIRRGGIIKSVINFRFPVSSLKKNENNVVFNVMGRATELEYHMDNVLENDVKVFFVTFCPNSENVSPDNFLGARGFKRCKNIQVFYDINEHFHQMKEDYENELYIRPVQSVVDSYKSHFGDFQDIKNAIYN